MTRHQWLTERWQIFGFITWVKYWCSGCQRLVGLGVADLCSGESSSTHQVPIKYRNDARATN